MHRGIVKRNISSILSRFFVRKPNPHVFLDITIAGQPKGKLVFELFADQAPKTAENFRRLCKGDAGMAKSAKVPLHYKGSPFHRIIPGFMCQSGDFTKKDGTGGESIYGDVFPDENLNLSHDRPGILSMANRGPNTNSSQFFITTEACQFLDGNYVAFGQLVEGLDILKEIEACGTKLDTGTPTKRVLISNCGEYTPEQAAEKKPEEKSQQEPKP